MGSAPSTGATRSRGSSGEPHCDTSNKGGRTNPRGRAESVSAVLAAIDSIRLVGSTEVVAAAEHVRHMAADWQAALVEKAMNLDGLLDPLTEFRNAARKDLGHPSP